MAVHPHCTSELNWFGCETSDILLPETNDQGKQLEEARQCRGEVNQEGIANESE
jgi:hypothetical protein